MAHGKTTLAKTIETFFPDKFKRTLELSTRKIRDGEIDNVDYDFISNDEFYSLKEENKLFEYVEFQFSPNRYGARYSELDDEKWNILIVSIEGLLQAMKNINEDDSAILINILIDEELDIERESRSPKTEENYNLAVLNAMTNKNENEIRFHDTIIGYEEINYSKLKRIRNDKELLKEYLMELYIYGEDV